MKNKPSTSNANKVNNRGSGLDDISSPPHTSVSSTLSSPDTNFGYSSNKRKLTRLSQIDSSGSVSKRQDTRDRIDLLLVNALSNENEASPKQESPKSGNELFCASLVEAFDLLNRKTNQWLILK